MYITSLINYITLFIKTYEPIQYMFIGLGVMGIMLILSTWIKGDKK